MTMATAHNNEEHWRALERRYTAAPVPRAFGFTLEIHGLCEVDVLYDGAEAALNVSGHVSGGAISAMVDSGLMQACRSVLRPGANASTRELKVNYLRPAKRQPLRAVGRIEYISGRTAVGVVRVQALDGERVALGTGSVAFSRASLTQ
jgi:uncharacterized protein (TIGR00369 family)